MGGKEGECDSVPGLRTQRGGSQAIFTICKKLRKYVFYNRNILLQIRKNIFFQYIATKHGWKTFHNDLESEQKTLDSDINSIFTVLWYNA